MSPLAAKLALCVLAKHATGPSKAELMASLGLRNETVANHCYLDVRTSLRSIMEADLILFNNIFVHTKYRLKLPFTNTTVPLSGVQVTKVGFEYPKQAMDYINRWGESVTYKRVQDILNPSDVSTASQMVVVNAAYFKASWEFPFNLLYSKMEKFYITEKSSLLVPMMNLVGEFQFNENAPNYQLLNLYLACWGGSLTIVVPTARYGLATLLEEIAKNPSMIKVAKEKVKYKMMKITLPRIKIKANIDLLEELDKIGIQTVLNNFSSGLDEIIYKNPPDSKDVPALSNMKQKVVLDVDETGSFRHRYAEDDIVRSNQDRIYNDDPKNYIFVVNHPFLFIVNVMGSGADFGTRRTSISGKPVVEMKELFVGAYYGPQKFD